jgi:hypothetical protein
MGNELFRSYDLGLPGRHQILQERVSRDKEVAFIGAAQDENIIRVNQAIPQSSHSREQRFRFGQIHRQNAQMVPDSFKLWSSGVPGEKQSLKHYGINREANTTIRFSGK